jgi:hypothetical protein
MEGGQSRDRSQWLGQMISVPAGTAGVLDWVFICLLCFPARMPMDVRARAGLDLLGLEKDKTHSYTEALAFRRAPHW